MRILIEVPTYDGSISRATSESLFAMYRGGFEVDFKARPGYGCAMARNLIAADALDAGYDYVMMVDNDIAFPADALVNLIEHDADFATGYYLNRYARGERKYTTLYRMGDGFQMIPADELKAARESGVKAIDVKACGMGCCLIKTSVFFRMGFPWFEWTDISRNPRSAPDVHVLSDDIMSGGEDVNFCNTCRALGIPIVADTRVACGHGFREVVWP